MTSRNPAIRPIQLSTLKVLNPPDDEVEHGKDRDGQADVQQVQHGVLRGRLGMKQTSHETVLNWANQRSKQDPCGPEGIPNKPHAGAQEPWQRLRIGVCGW